MKKLILMLMLFMPMATFAQKFGHVNAQEIMASMPEFIKARGEVEAQAKQYDNDLKAMQDEMQRKYEDYEKNKSTMNETKRKETEDSLSQMYRRSSRQRRTTSRLSASSSRTRSALSQTSSLRLSRL